MQSGFDPYRAWLDIPDAAETPNHYRLLGLRLFEDDADRIVQAVAQIGQVLVRHGALLWPATDPAHYLTGDRTGLEGRTR